ncbi:MAG: MBL fold metallo-hydrolase [Fervidobacterium sp.]
MEIMRNFKVFQTSGELRTNTYLLSTNGVNYIIDPGKGVSEFVQLDTQYQVILTHGHYDHISGLNEIRPQKLYISNEESVYLSDPYLNLSILFGELFSIDIRWYNVDEYFQVIPAPGHTYGSRVIIFDGFIFTGDVVFIDTIGRVDLYLDNSVRRKMREEMKNTVSVLREKFKKLPQDWIVCPGHGNIFELRELFKLNPFFK